MCFFHESQKVKHGIFSPSSKNYKQAKKLIRYISPYAPKNCLEKPEYDGKEDWFFTVMGILGNCFSNMLCFSEYFYSIFEDVKPLEAVVFKLFWLISYMLLIPNVELLLIGSLIVTPTVEFLRLATKVSYEIPRHAANAPLSLVLGGISINHDLILRSNVTHFVFCKSFYQIQQEFRHIWPTKEILSFLSL